MSGRAMKTVRSDFLVHWTGGKDIEEEYADTESKDYQDKGARREKYIIRLRTTLEDGLWMNSVDIGLHSEPDGGLWETIHWPATCFTEIKLSNVDEHAQMYGFLGFGFTRQFVMERCGGPVIYVPGIKELDLGAMDVVSHHFHKLIKVIWFLAQRTTILKPLDSQTGVVIPEEISEFTEFVSAIGLGKFLVDSGYLDRSEDPRVIFDNLRSSLITCAVFVKVMSDSDCYRNFQRLEESEWRIPYTKLMVDKGKIRKTGMVEPAGKIPFNNNDLKVLIFPDEETRREALDDPYINSWLFTKPIKPPVIATVKECLQF